MAQVEAHDMNQESGQIPRDVAGDAMAFYAYLAGLLAGGERLALCTVIRLAGSGPRRAGAKMIVREAGESVGTVGGGVLEVHATRWAREALGTGRSLCRSFSLDRTQAADDGMTCGGQAEVLVECLEGSAAGVSRFFADLHALLARGGRGWLATTIRQEGDYLSTGRVLVAEGRVVAELLIPGHSLPEEIRLEPAPTTPRLVERGGLRYFLEPLSPPLTVYVFGGGHIAVHLVPLCHRLGFRTVVVDDRADFACQERFPEASRLMVAASFERALEDLLIDEESYVVIVTRGHGGDAAVLRQVLARRPAYVGMIGSARKRGLVFEQLRGEGVTAEELGRVACPIGLPIGAETPEEIAVSIAAELVATRASVRAGR
jgi:xanthine dehydrogenase accessory factor